MTRTMHAALGRASLVFFLAICLLAAAGSAHSAPPDPDRYMVKFRDGSGVEGVAALFGARAELLVELRPQNAVAARISPSALAGLRRHPAIEYIEHDPLHFPSAEAVPYGIQMVQADPHGSPMGIGPGTGFMPKICIIDSGYHLGHEDLPGLGSGVVVTGRNFTPGPGGVIDPDDWASDGCGHGTHVAGTIAAVRNGVGIVGVIGDQSGHQPPFALHIARVFDNSCAGVPTSVILDAANECASQGAHIINMSLGCRGQRCATKTAESAYQSIYSAGILIAAAAGNAGNNDRNYPASYPAVISVAAVDSDGVVASFSQTNNAVELSAPGVGVVSTVPWLDQNIIRLGDATWAGNYVHGARRTTLDGISGAIEDGGLCSGVGEWNGKVVFCLREQVGNYLKVANVAQGGGVAAVIYNSPAASHCGPFYTWSNDEGIPAISISCAQAQEALQSSGTLATVVSHIDFDTSGYEAWDGTSMATPHVAGVAALVWSHNSAWSNEMIRQAMRASTVKLGSSNSYGYGLVQAKATLELLGGSGPEPPPPPPPPPEEPGEIVAQVESLALAHVARGPNTNTTATATIVDNSNGSRLSGASVTGCFSGAVNACGVGTTNTLGQVSFSSGNYKSGTASFCVTDVSGPNTGFDAGGSCTP